MILVLVTKQVHCDGIEGMILPAKVSLRTANSWDHIPYEGFVLPEHKFHPGVSHAWEGYPDQTACVRLKEFNA